MRKKKESAIADLFGDPPAQKGEQGAPAALKAIEAHELQCRNEKDAVHAEWKEAYEKIVDHDQESLNREDRLRRAYLDALALWDEATKKLGVFDKNVAVERREGEKILVADCKEIFAQYELSLKLAMEAYIIKLSQDAALCDSAESFHLAHAEAIRSTRDGAIAAARRDGVLPAWIS